MSSLVFSSVEHVLVRRSAAAAARKLNVDLTLAYNVILGGCVALFALRHLLRIIGRSKKDKAPRVEFVPEPKLGSKYDFDGNEDLSLEREAIRLRSRWSEFERFLLSQLPRRWRQFGLRSPLQVIIFVLLFVLNAAFTLARTLTFSGSETASWNHIHVVAHRCGFLSLAQLPILIALSGRNGIISFATGIDYQELRFLHKVMAGWMAAHAVIHTVDASVANAQWFGGAGAYQLYFHNYLGQTGLVMIVGLVCIFLFSLRAVRKRFYELFIAMHVIGAILILAGLMYHVPRLSGWVWAPIAIWAFERTARLAQLLSVQLLARLQLRSPMRKATATLVEGAIVLRVPFKGDWSSAQHAYLSFPGLALGQSHPFSIANVPSDSNATTSKGSHEMLFVMGVRRGVTATIAAHLEQFSSKSTQLRVGVEGPYGVAGDAHRYDDVLFVAGGTGITHVLSMLSDIVTRAQAGKKCFTTRIKLIWTIQNTNQMSWVVDELLEAVKVAQEAGILISLAIHVTRGAIGDSGASTPVGRNRPEIQPGWIDSIASFDSFDSLNSLYHPQPNFYAPSRRASAFCESHLDLLLDAGAAATMHQGRPRLPLAIPAFVEGSTGSSLVVVCGPGKLARSVVEQTEKLASLYRVKTLVASFEC